MVDPEEDDAADGCEGLGAELVLEEGRQLVHLSYFLVVHQLGILARRLIEVVFNEM